MSQVEMAPRAAAAVETFLGDVKAGNLEGALALLDPGVVVDEPASLPFGGLHHGPDGFVGGLITVLVRMADFTVERFAVLDAGDTAVARLDVCFSDRASGRTLSTRLTEIYEVREGLITSIDVFYKDTKEFLEFFAS